MTGTIVIIAILVVIVPVAIIMSGLVVSGLLGYLLNADVDARTEGSEMHELSRKDFSPPN